MNHLEDKNVQSTEIEKELEIFGRSKTREEIKAERRAQRALEVEALREARRLAKWERKAESVQNHKDLLVMGCILATVVIVIGVILGIQFAKSNKKLQKEALYQPSETNTGYFLDADAVPELSDEGFSVVVNEVYYTVGEHLCVQMTLGNGVDKPMRLDTLEVKIYNGDTDKLIAGGYTEDISDSYIVATGDYDAYTLYIRPEHVKIKDDTLEKLTYEIIADGTIMED